MAVVAAHTAAKPRLATPVTAADGRQEHLKQPHDAKRSAAPGAARCKCSATWALGSGAGGCDKAAWEGALSQHTALHQNAVSCAGVRAAPAPALCTPLVTIWFAKFCKVCCCHPYCPPENCPHAEPWTAGRQADRAAKETSTPFLFFRVILPPPLRTTLCGVRILLDSSHTAGGALKEFRRRGRHTAQAVGR